MLARLPIRLRLSLAFAGVMCLMILGTSLFLRFTLASELDTAIDQGLRARGADVAALVAQAPGRFPRSRGSPITERGEAYAQVLDRRGRVLDSTPRLRGRTLLDPAQLRRALRGPLFLEWRPGGRDVDSLRVLAQPVASGGRRLVVVIGASLEERERAVHKLSTLLYIGGPLLVLLASAAGYGLAAAALRPVEWMRRRAQTISGRASGERLPVPLASDEIRRLGETLNQMLERVEASLDRERTFVADASHELRTPLAILRAELELALRGQRSPDELRDAIISAGEEADRLARLTDDLLGAARADQGALVVRKDRVDPGQLLARVRDQFAARAHDDQRPLALSAPGGPVFMGDGLQLEQALGNLVDNALRHGGGRVTLGIRPLDGWMTLFVRDEGDGFPPEFLDRAFERFARADAARGRGGTGLGLAIVRAVARAHGGDAHVANMDGGGAEARLTLPYGGPAG